MNVNMLIQVKKQYEKGQLSPIAFRMYSDLFLESYSVGHYVFEMCNSELRTRSGLSRHQLFRVRADLIHFGLIETQTAQGSKRVMYTLVNGVQWTS